VTKVNQPPARPSFEEYAATEPRVGKLCWLCGIPEREEIERVVLSGRGTKAAAYRYLRDQCGYGDEATTNRIDHHFANHVRQAA
jgi:hypothetical protein